MSLTLRSLLLVTVTHFLGLLLWRKCVCCDLWSAVFSTELRLSPPLEVILAEAIEEEASICVTLPSLCTELVNVFQGLGGIAAIHRMGWGGGLEWHFFIPTVVTMPPNQVRNSPHYPSSALWLQLVSALEQWLSTCGSPPLWQTSSYKNIFTL